MNEFKTKTNIQLGKDCLHFEMCKELIKLETNQKFNKIKMILFTVFGFISLVGLNCLVFLLSNLTQFHYVMIVFDILVIATMLAIPIKNFFQSILNIQNGNIPIANKNTIKQLIEEYKKGEN